MQQTTHAIHQVNRKTSTEKAYKKINLTSLFF